MDSIQDFFIENQLRKGCLVFADDTNLECVQQEAKKKFGIVKTNCEDITQIRAMDDCCLIVTDEKLMRGVDYRLKEKGSDPISDGIDLLITAPFSNKMAHLQGLARVGRYNAPCSRFRLRGVPAVDQQRENSMYIRLSNAPGLKR